MHLKMEFYCTMTLIGVATASAQQFVSFKGHVRVYIYVHIYICMYVYIYICASELLSQPSLPILKVIFWPSLSSAYAMCVCH